MKQAAAIAFIALVLLLATFAIGLSLRTASTTVNYPAYSSLNNQENGLKGLYETMRRLGVPVERKYKALPKMAGTNGTTQGTLLYAGPDANRIKDFREMETKRFEAFEQAAQPGLRLVFLVGETSQEFVPDPPQKIEKPISKDNAKTDKPTRNPPEDNLLKRWVVEMKSVDTPNPNQNGGPVNDALSNFGGKRVTRTWFFGKWDDKWKPDKDADGKVYLLERSFGSGSVALLLGLEYFTNKTLLTKVDSVRIASLMSGPRPLIFDEFHLGVADDDTVAGYARQRHLEWLLLGLVALAALYVWRSSVSFVPALPEIKGVEIAGREAHMALTSLLSQSITRPQLTREIIAAWRDSFRMLPSSKVRITEESLSSFADAHDGDAPAQYNRVSRAAASRSIPP